MTTAALLVLLFAPVDVAARRRLGAFSQRERERAALKAPVSYRVGCGCDERACANASFYRVCPDHLRDPGSETGPNCFTPVPQKCDCEKPPEERARQCAWTAWLRRCSSGGGSGGAPGPPSAAGFGAPCGDLDAYARAVYGTAAADLSLAAFFWTGVPFFEKMDVEHMQGEIAVLRTCVACAGHLRPGALWIPVDDVTQKPRAPWVSTLYGPPMARHDVPAAPPTSPPGEHAFFPGFFAAADLSARLADHSWVEVMRIARVDDKRDEGDRCLANQVWYWHAPGSGIWLDVGASLVLTPDYVGPTRKFTSCRAARADGFDTIQIPAFRNLSHAFELVDCRDYGGAGPDAPLEMWEAACPPAAARLRRGTPAPRDGAPALANAPTAARPCRCDPRFSFLNCYGGDA